MVRIPRSFAALSSSFCRVAQIKSISQPFLAYLAIVPPQANNSSSGWAKTNNMRFTAVLYQNPVPKGRDGGKNDRFPIVTLLFLALGSHAIQAKKSGKSNQYVDELYQRRACTQYCLNEIQSKRSDQSPVKCT